MPSIAVLTTAIPERLGMLAECCLSVEAQTLRPTYHLIGLDYGHAGNIPNLNRLGRSADEHGCEWLMPLADDDYLLPLHLETLAAYADDADVIYSWCEVRGRDWKPNRAFDAELLRQGNFIPATALIRTSLVEQAGWWDENPEQGFEDWAMWKTLLALGARFRCVEEVTWVYRFGHGNLSLGDWVSPTPLAVA